MNETQAIEHATADAFILLYNSKHGTDYAPMEYSDVPDVRCTNSKGKVFNLEVTLTEDRPDDIKARLGRSEDRSMETLKAHLKKVRAGLADPLDRASCLNSNVSSILTQRIRTKMNKRYGPDTALIVRDTSGVDWNWDLVTNEIRRNLEGILNPFDKGIWIVNASKDRIFRIL